MAYNLIRVNAKNNLLVQAFRSMKAEKRMFTCV